jgi:anti-sigma regulatory factor (Ser/Thr protein kinase)
MGPAIQLRLAGGYYFHTLTRIVRDLQPLLTLREPALITIDMRDLTFMGPAALALTAATLHSVRSKSLPMDGSTIIAPHAPGIFRYLRRMDFLELVLDKLDLEYADSLERHDTKGFRECRRFASEEECHAVAKGLADSAHERVVVDELSSQSLYTCLTELAENVYYHADSPLGGVAAAQALPKSNEVELAIVDLGIGIKESLSKNPIYHAAAADDLTAIRLALVPTVTATPHRNSGYGLAFTQYLLGVNGGRLMVRSGHGHVQRGAKTVDRIESDSLPGTVVGLRIRTDRPFDFTQAWNQLTDALTDVPALLSQFHDAND